MTPSPLYSAPATAPGAEVADQRVTHLVGGTRGEPIDATLTTRFADAVEAAHDSATRCSGGRVRCSLVDKLTISVGAIRIDIPKRAVVLLADVNRGKVMRLRAGGYELVLDCGDASAGYEARLFFDRRMVHRLEIWAIEAGALEDVTTYKDLSHAFP